MDDTHPSFRGRDALLAVIEDAYAQADGEALTRTLRDGGADARFLPLESPQGHDAFLVDIARFGPAVRGFLDGLA